MTYGVIILFFWWCGLAGARGQTLTNVCNTFSLSKKNCCYDKDDDNTWCLLLFTFGGVVL
jgi:hypothetical protein